MIDIHNKETRSYIMSRIRSKNTKPEILVRKYLHAHGFRFRIHDSRLPGHPDIVLKKYKTAIFIHGCFWHGHENCKYFKVPSTRTEWWAEKFRKNKEADRRNYLALKKEHWNVQIIWECELKSKMQASTFEKVISNLEDQDK